MNLTPQFTPRTQMVSVPQDRPVYRVSDQKFFGPDGVLYEEGDIISLRGDPTAEMTPLNAMAEENMRKYLAKLDKKGEEVAAKNGTSYTGLVDAFETAIQYHQSEEGMSKLASIEQLNVERKKEIFSNPAKQALKAAAQIERVVESETAPVLGGRNKLKLDLDDASYSKQKNTVNKKDE